MMNLASRRKWILGLVWCLSLMPSWAAISVYVSKPDQPTTEYTSTTVETFDAPFTLGNNTSVVNGNIGQWQMSATGYLNIDNDDQFGSGTGIYARLGAQAGSAVPVELVLNAPAQYFAFAWNAGDAQNGVSFYNGTTFLGRYSTADIVAALSATTVTAIDNTIYQTSEYRGKFNEATTNPAEPYAFINYIADPSTLITRVVFDNSNNTGSGYEFDNVTVRATSPIPLGSFVPIGSLVVPEPGVPMLGLLGVLFILRRRK
jgi:hypothetical protein